MKTIKTLLALAIILSSEILFGQSPSFYDLTFKADSTTSPYKSSNSNYVFIRSKRGTEPVKPTASGDSIKTFNVSNIVLVFSEESSDALANREEYNQERWENIMATYPEFFQAKTTYKNICQCSPEAGGADFKQVQGFYVYYTPQGGSVVKKEEPKKEEPKKEVEVAKVEAPKKAEPKKEEVKKEEPKKEVAKDDSKKEELKKQEAEKEAELAKKEELKKEEQKKKEEEKEAELAKKEELKKEELKKKEGEKEAELAKKEENKKEELKKKEAEKEAELVKKEELKKEEQKKKDAEKEAELAKKEALKKEQTSKVAVKEEPKKEAEVVKKEEPKKEAIADDGGEATDAEADAKKKPAVPAKPRRAKDPKACRTACYGSGESDLNAFFRDNIVLTKKMKKDEVDLKLQLNVDGTVKKVIILPGGNVELNKLVEEACKNMVWNASVKAGLTIKSEVHMILKYDKELKGLKANELMVNPRLGPKCVTCTSDSDLFPN